MPSHREGRAGRLARHSRNAARIAFDIDGQRRSLLREYLWKVSRGVTPWVGVDSDGVHLIMSTADHGVGRFTFVGGRYEMQKLEMADMLIRKLGRSVRGMGFVDIGANIGTTTLPALKTYGATHVWAFEPEPVNLRVLRANMALNAVDEETVTLAPVALSDTNGLMEMELSPTNSGDHRVVVTDYEGMFDEQGRERIEVPVVPFDEAVDEYEVDLDGIGLVWMDTQGHEGRVLAGASRLLGTRLPVVTEYWPYALSRADGLNLFHDLVAEHFSEVVDIGGDVPVRYPAKNVAVLAPRFAGLAYTDLLLLP